MLGGGFRNSDYEVISELEQCAMMPFKDLIHRKLERLGPSLTTRQSGRVWFRSGRRDHTQEHLQMNFSKSVDVTDAVVAEPAVQTADVPRSNASTQAANVLQTEVSGTDKTITTDPDHYDVFMITSDDDQEDATKLADILVKFCKSCCDYDLTVHPELELGENKLDYLRSGLASSSYRFIFIGDGFRENDLVKFGTDAALMDMISRRDQSIIPVKAHAGIPTPPLLKMFRSLDVHKLLYGRRLDDIADINKLTEADVHKPLLENIIKMVSRSTSSFSVRSLAADRSPRTSPQHCDVLRRHHGYLVQNIDPDGGLVSGLFSAEVLSHRDVENIRVEKTFYDRNEHLIRVLMRKSAEDYGKFLDVLCDTQQSHIADALCGNSSSSSVVR